jgi:hypothetical protein
MSEASHAHSGGCLCRQVRYHFDAEPIAAVHCHCKDCQKATGSGFATVFGLADSDVEIRTEQSLGSFTVTADSGQSVTRQFCRHCGSPLFTLAENNPGFVWIKAGSLDDSSWLQPTDCCWAGSATSWAPPAAQLTQHEGNP